MNQPGIERHHARARRVPEGASRDDPSRSCPRRAPIGANRVGASVLGERCSRVASRTGGVSVRKRGPRAYQVRVHPFPAKTFPTKESAQRYELALLVRRAEGDRHVEPAQRLAEEVNGWLRRWESTGPRRPKTVAFYHRSAKFWDCLETTRVNAVRRAVVEDLIAERAAEHPRSAKNELEFLKRVLKDARARG
jgi:hypothetical protein